MKRFVSFLLISFCFSAFAYAATATVNATGTITSTCSFTGNTAGTLAVAPSAPSIINSGTGAGGTPPTVSVSYLGTPTITVMTPTSFDSEPAAAQSLTKNFGLSASSQALGTLGPNTAGDGVEGTYATGSADTVSVSMGAQFANGAAVPMGAYSLSTTVTCQ